MTRLTASFAALLLIAAFGAAKAQPNCNNLHLLTTLHLTRIPGDTRNLAPFTVNGVEKHFLLDTGGSMTQIKDAAAKSLQLIVQPGNIRMYDARGRMSNDMASVPEFSLGTLHGTHGFMPVTPNENATHPDPFDGILALDYLRRNDVEVDFGTNTLNIISPDHCPERVTYWSPPVVAIVPFQKSQDMQQMVVPVTLDGQELTAMIDTGASRTSMRIDIAEIAI